MGDSFKSFYKRPTLTTPNTRAHHQTTQRVTGGGNPRKGINMVAACHGQQKKDPLIDQWFKNETKGVKPIPSGVANRLMKTYGIKFRPEQSFQKAIKDTGIFLFYNNKRKVFSLVRR